MNVKLSISFSFTCSLPSAFPLQPNLGMILNRTYSDPSCLVAAGAAGAAGAAAGANNLRRTDSNLSMMTDDTASEVHQPHDPPPAIATNGTGTQDSTLNFKTVQALYRVSHPIIHRG